MAASTSDISSLAPSETSSQKRINWSVTTTEALIRIWEDNLTGLRSNTRNARIYRTMADQLNSGLPTGEGPYTAKQIRQKLENLNKHYRKLRRSGTTTGAKGIEWPFYWQLHSFLGSLPINDRDLVEESVEVPVVYSAEEGSDVMATYSDVSAAATDPSDSSQVSGVEESPSALTIPCSSQSSSDSSKTSRKRPSSLMNDLLALHQRAEERAAKAACDSLELRKQLVELHKESNSMQSRMLQMIENYFASKQSSADL